MFSSAEVFDALRRRTRRSLRPERPAGEFPSDWAEWFVALRERVGRVTGATAEAFIDLMLAREPALPPGAAASLNQWQSFATLWRQDWTPASRDSRATRAFALLVALLVHLLLAVFLVYLAYVRLMALPDESESRRGEDVIQVQYIGQGTPEDTGGGPASSQQVAVQTPPLPPAPSQPIAAATPTTPSPPAARAAVSVPVPTPDTPLQVPPVAQPLQVTETAQPDQTFTLPPPRTVEVPQPQLPTKELSVTSRDITVVEIADVATPALPQITLRSVAVQPIATSDIQRPLRDVPLREVPVPLASVPLPQIAAPATPPLPALRVPTREVAARDIPLPAENIVPAAATSNAAAATASSAASATPSTSVPSTSSAQNPSTGNAWAAAPATGVGATADPKPGALPSTRRGDDWDAADRSQPGGQKGTPGGLFNADGSPRLAPGDGKVGGGLAPGTITEDFAKIDRNGTWLKRPSTDYAPTSFDKFWVPSETLLQEWVRRSIKEVLIPIPGTSKTIKCSVVLLALGGSCGITDPNLQDVEATARKAPEVPFKRELQEDQKSLSSPDSGR